MINGVDAAVLIGCLGVAAVVAVPRHEQAARDVRLLEVTALTRGVNTAAQLAHSRWLAAQQPPTIDGVRGVVAMTNGYPSPATLPLMLAAAETVAFVYDAGIWRHAGRSADQACGVYYQPPAAPGQNPVIGAQTTGC